jgi:hypothetical protein
LKRWTPNAALTTSMRGVCKLRDAARLVTGPRRPRDPRLPRDPRHPRQAGNRQNRKEGPKHSAPLRRLSVRPRSPMCPDTMPISKASDRLALRPTSPASIGQLLNSSLVLSNVVESPSSPPDGTPSYADCLQKCSRFSSLKSDIVGSCVLLFCDMSASAMSSSSLSEPGSHALDYASREI